MKNNMKLFKRFLSSALSLSVILSSLAFTGVTTLAVTDPNAVGFETEAEQNYYNSDVGKNASAAIKTLEDGNKVFEFTKLYRDWSTNKYHSLLRIADKASDGSVSTKQVTAGSTYTISFKYKNNVEVQGYGLYTKILFVHSGNNMGNLLSGSEGCIGNFRNSGLVAEIAAIPGLGQCVPVNGDWVEYTSTFTVPDGVGTCTELALAFSVEADTENASLYVDDIIVKKYIEPSGEVNITFDNDEYYDESGKDCTAGAILDTGDAQQGKAFKFTTLPLDWSGSASALRIYQKNTDNTCTPFKVTAGKKYIITYKYKKISGYSQWGPYPKIAYVDSGTEISSFITNGPNNWSGGITGIDGMSTGAAGDWVEYKSVFTVPEGTQNREIALLLGEGALTTNAEIWVDDIKVEEYGPHSGGYQADKRVIDFNNYTVSKQNSWGPDYQATLYFSTITESDNTYLHYEVNDGSASNWRPCHAMKPSADGSDANLEKNSVYIMTLKVRTDNVPGSGMTPFIAYYNGFFTQYENVETFSNDIVYDTKGEWVDLTLKFNTPEEYTNGNGFAFGFYPGGGINYSYDIDDIVIEKVTDTELYIDTNGDNEFELYTTLTGGPGSDLVLPETDIKEVYNADGTGYTETYSFNGWYSDEGLSKDAILKYGNFNTKIYSTAVVTMSDTENQVGFAGFDEYSNTVDGMSISKSDAEISYEDAYSGSASLKLNLKANTQSAAELKNDCYIDAKLGQTYTVSFMYKAQHDVKAGVSAAESGNVIGSNYICNYTDLKASDSWEKASITVNAEGVGEFKNGCSLALVVLSDSDNTVYIDAVTINSATESVVAIKAENGIRFLMTYNCGGDNKLVLDGAEYAIAERGILIAGADNENALTIEGTNENGIVKLTADSLDDFYSRNSVTKATVFSAVVNGLPENDDYSFTARGYIKLADGSVYYTDYITASAKTAKEPFNVVLPADAVEKGDDNGVSYESTKHTTGGKYYLFLPEGTVLSSAKTYKVEAYLTVGSTQIADFNGTGEYTLNQDSYCLLTVYGGELNKDLEIAVPYELANNVMQGWEKDIPFIKITNSLENADSSAVNYIFIADTHAGAYPKAGTTLDTLYEPENTTYWRSVGIKEKIQSIVDYANSNDKIDFVIVGGDIVNGYETVYSPGYQTALANTTTTGVTNVHNYVTYQIKTVLEPLKNCKKPVFVIPGNHDDNKPQAIVYNNINKLGIAVDESIKNLGFNIKDIVTDIDWKHDIFDNFVTKGAVQDASYTANDIVDASYTGDKQEKLSKYYYYDLENKNTRVFCLDVMDTRHKLDADGNVAAFDSSNHVSYSPQQLKWLAENLEQAKGDIVILSHMAADSKNDGARNCEYLLEILAAYQNRSTCNITIGDTVIAADFTSAAGKILSYSAGHIHEDRTSFSEEANIWQIFSGMGSGCGNVVSATENVIYKYFVDFNHWFTGKDEKLISPAKK